jgi:hypothetical protein
VAAAQTFEAITELPASRHLPLRTDRAVESCVAAVESWLDSPGD